MKKLILLFIALISIAVYADARMNVAIVGGSPPAGAPAGNCTSPQIFGWSMEGSTDITAETPAGCTSNATKAPTFSGGSTAISTTRFQDGAKSLYIRYAGDYATIPVSDGSTTEGTLDFYIYFDDSLPENWTRYVEFRYNDTNRVVMFCTGSNVFEVAHYGNSGTPVEKASTTTISLDTWYHVIIKWKVGAAATLSIQVGGEAAQTSAATIGTMSSAPNTLKWINSGGGNLDIYNDLIKVYTTWQ